ncbi:hypothetical protein [Cupriavidus pauculus]|nr:hypothetical protein [Cupriavidus pauculus]KAB0605375.1 hypothetical protein F7R19_02320 [Cupriavidus pauculus]MBY4728989.1 hypothetical protein [Cupriavidus pauculus]MCM3605290.1 hypothetical protein [Cupriavidus pauculus]UAK99739.1 hypothetical protein K8O84_17525 [Cupriavidus pauculus]
MTSPMHGSWIPVRKDFADPSTTRCHARSAKGGRHHGFPEGHAWILRGPDGHEYPFGLECARAALAVPGMLDQIPDYTERDAIHRLDAALAPLPRRKPTAAELELERRNAATRYVVLRMEKVASVPRVQPTVRFAALDDLYQQIAAGRPLTQAQAQRVLAIERSPATPPKLKSVNLLDVYTAHVKLEWLIAASNRVDRIRFLRSLHDWLARHLVLSAAQIEAAGIVMHPHAFRSAWPDEDGAAERF